MKVLGSGKLGTLDTYVGGYNNSINASQEYAEIAFRSTTIASACTQEYAEVLYNLTQPNVTVTAQWVEEIHKSAVVPNVTVTAQWVEEIHKSAVVPNVTVTAQWVEYIFSATPPVEVQITSQWVEYISKMPNYAKVTQEYAETLAKPTTVLASVSQEYTETLSNALAVAASISQQYVESLSERINNAFTSTIYGEIIGAIWVSIFPARVSELHIEAISATGINTRIHNTSVMAEVIRKTDTGERVTSNYCEIHRIPTTVNASVSANFVEIIRKTRGTSTSINTNSPI